MKVFLSILFMFLSLLSHSSYANPDVPVQSLNAYVEFISASANSVTDRFVMLQKFEADRKLYLKRQGLGLRLPSSGPPEEFFYRKALAGDGLKPTEREQLNRDTEKMWALLNKLDETGKALETYVRLKDFEKDELKKAGALTNEMQAIFKEFSQAKSAFYVKITKIYRSYQPYNAANPYLAVEKAMEPAIKKQQNLIDSLPFYFNEEVKSDWPEMLVRQSLLNDEKLLENMNGLGAKLQYPASDAVGNVRAALLAMQSIKSNALDDHNFAARQSAVHGNEVYMRLLKQFNQDLIVSYKSFVNYSQPVIRMLYQPAFSPVMESEPSVSEATGPAETPAFTDHAVQDLKIRRAPAPAGKELVGTLNGYIDFINKSLRQMHLLQILVRNYQSSAEYYRDPARAQKRANLSYSHEDFKLPASEYALLLNSSSVLAPSYRPVVTGQLEVLMNMLKEMDGLSVELIAYCNEKRYLKDQLKRSDAVIDRYLTLFDTFDQKKEQLYNDIRRIHESYPNATPTSSWYVSGSAMLRTMDDGHKVMFGLKDFFKGKTTEPPAIAQLESNARQMIEDEYKNMKGLKRYGRSNGLCPYSPYEDLAGNSTRFAEMTGKIKYPVSSTGAHPFQSFYYFYNNELVYQYNKFVELSKAGLLKTINQPDLFVFRKLKSQKPLSPPTEKVSSQETQTEQASTMITQAELPQVLNKKTGKPANAKAAAPEAAASEPPAVTQRDTVYVERVRVDTVYVDRAASLQNVTRSLDGFAPNNMVLLLDVSSSMNSPAKMPLLKRSIKSLLTLLRPEDQISIVLYSGKARVVLKPTSGSRSAEIARMIDLLQSDGDTDGNEGIKLAYKTANKQYLRGGNNRIVLATDGEFPVSEEVLQMIGQNAGQDVYLSVFTFGKNQHTGQKLKKLSELGKGTYAHVTDASADLQLILEAQAKRQSSK